MKHFHLLSFFICLLQISLCNKHIENLVNHLKQRGFMKSKAIEKVFLMTDRRNYFPHDVSDDIAYDDHPKSIGFHATISGPHMHVFVLERMLPYLQGENVRALDIGSGSGCLTVYMALLTGEGGQVIGIDHIPELIEQSKKNVIKDHKKYLLDSGTLTFKVADGRKPITYFREYDVINVGAAIEDNKFGHMLFSMMSDNSVLVAPFGKTGSSQTMKTYYKKNGVLYHSENDDLGVIYMPLASKKRQLG